MPFPHTLSQSLSPAKGAGHRPSAPGPIASSGMSGPTGQPPPYYGGQSPAGEASCHPIFAAETETPQSHGLSASALATPQQRVPPGGQDASSVEAKPFHGTSPSPRLMMESHFSTPQPQQHPQMPVKSEAVHMPGSNSGSAFVQVPPSCHARGSQYPPQHCHPGQMPPYHPPSGPAHPFQAPHPAGGPSPPPYANMHQEPSVPSHHLSLPPASSPALRLPGPNSAHSILGSSPSPSPDALTSPPNTSSLLSLPRGPPQPPPLTSSTPQPASAPHSLASPNPAVTSVPATPHAVIGTPEPNSERSRSIVTSSEELRSGAGHSRKRGREFGISASAEDGYSWLKYVPLVHGQRPEDHD